MPLYAQILFRIFANAVKPVYCFIKNIFYFLLILISVALLGNGIFIGGILIGTFGGSTSIAVIGMGLSDILFHKKYPKESYEILNEFKSYSKKTILPIAAYCFTMIVLYFVNSSWIIRHNAILSSLFIDGMIGSVATGIVTLLCWRLESPLKTAWKREWDRQYPSAHAKMAARKAGYAGPS